MAHGSSNLALISYLRDGDGRVTSESDQELPHPSTAGAQAYAYDNADDPTELRGTPGYSYNVADELTSSPRATYSYNSLGERTALTPSSGAPTGYAYNQAGQLTTYTPPTGSTTSYTYDGNGVRASKTTGSNTSHFAWDESGAQPLLLTDTANSYIYGPNNTPIEQISSSGTPSYLHHDQLGSTRLITNQSGTTTGSFTYSPYGTVTASSGSATTPFGYAGQYTDTESGLQYDQARYYDPSTGQFISNDPLEAVTGQPYSYAGDDPVNATDPTGLQCSPAFEAICQLGSQIKQGITTGVTGLGNTAAGLLNGATGGASTRVLNSVGIQPDECSPAFRLGNILGPAVGAVFGDDEGIAAEGSSIDETLSGLRSGRSPNVYQVDTPEQLQGLFDQLSEGGQPVENNYPGELVRLPDGSTVGLRDASKSGGPTIDIAQPGQPPVKIHLP